MNKTISYKESTAIAIQAMMSAARKDEYADRKRKSNFPQNRKKRDVTLKDIREWNKRRNYKEDTGITINAMMESAVKDPYVDLNPNFKKLKYIWLQHLTSNYLIIRADFT